MTSTVLRSYLLNNHAYLLKPSVVTMVTVLEV